MECDFCESKQVKIAYKVPTSQRDLSIYVCKNCGLVQSFPKIDHIKTKNIAISGEADWGNIRYGKSFIILKIKEIYS